MKTHVKPHQPSKILWTASKRQLAASKSHIKGDVVVYEQELWYDRDNGQMYVFCQFGTDELCYIVEPVYLN